MVGEEAMAGPTDRAFKVSLVLSVLFDDIIRSHTHVLSGVIRPNRITPDEGSTQNPIGDQK